MCTSPVPVASFSRSRARWGRGRESGPICARTITSNGTSNRRSNRSSASALRPLRRSRASVTPPGSSNKTVSTRRSRRRSRCATSARPRAGTTNSARIAPPSSRSPHAVTGASTMPRSVGPPAGSASAVPWKRVAAMTSATSPTREITVTVRCHRPELVRKRTGLRRKGTTGAVVERHVAIYNPVYQTP